MKFEKIEKTIIELNKEETKIFKFIGDLGYTIPNLLEKKGFERKEIEKVCKTLKEL